MKNQLLARVFMITAVLLLSIGSLKAQDIIVNGIYYQIWDYDEVIVAASPDGYSGDITIPETVTAQVSYYGEYYEQSFTVVGIDEYAFRDCTGLTHIDLPSTIWFIGNSAFYGCTSLAEVTLPSSLRQINKTAFGYCTSLKSVVLPPSLEVMDRAVFYYCTGLTDVTIPNSLMELNGTFIGCSSLTSVEIPQSIITLDGTFTNCSSLTSIELPESVEYIGTRTFDGCTALKSVVLPSMLDYIGEHAFRNCDDLMDITCRAVTPPRMFANNSEGFDYLTYNSARLFVPNASISTYKSTNWWSLFNNIMGLLFLNNSAVTMSPGQTFQLTAQFAPGFDFTGQVEWSSGMPGVATVSSTGLITAIAQGTAFIYADAGDEQAVCEVTVKGGSTTGDVNNDGEVNVADVNALINAILSGGVSAEQTQQFDANGDGEINVADVNWLINYILNN